MADRVYANLRFEAEKTGAKSDFNASANITMAGDDIASSTQLIGTSAETINLGEITGAPGAFAIKNLDATNYVEIGGDSGLTVFKLKLLPGQFHFFQPSSATIYAQANTADVRVQIQATEL